MSRKLPTATEFIEGILAGNRMLLCRAITLIESTKTEHQDLAQEIIEGCLPHSGNSVRIGITGVPGVGKSTFIEAFGNYIIEEENRSLAVLAVDPSSSKTRGSILG
ncbi:MAG TPA: methylmalonyl Co-A mutase-associated GTPase MeaB, partial [Balneolaceae bacterium]|nr:methylmalonyl Co-A mutase-associated GTPase MeaB [Balneolaceae bacterium]